MSEKLNENLQAIQALVQKIADAKITISTARKTVAEVLPIILQALRGKDFEKAGKILFQKIGGSNFYNLFLRDFFKSQHFILEYNVKKDCLVWYGSFDDIQADKYLDYFEELKKEREKEKAALSTEKKIEKAFSKIDKLSRKELEILSKLVNSKLHKKV